MLHPVKTKQFEKDEKKARKQRRNFEELEKVVIALIKRQPLHPKYKDHPLIGKWKGCRDCHVPNDWVLIYCINEKEKTITFQRIGSHSELFK